MEKLAFVFILICLTAHCAAEKAPGYRGIWYSNQPSGDEYAYKYSGGLGTYCADHTPLAVYAPKVNKTFFVYGGTKGLSAKKALLEMIGCYDHATKTLSRPMIIMEKGTDDAHHNPTLTIDKDGFLWVFISSHGGKDGFIYKSLAPYSIEGFERIAQREFTYPQPWYFEGHGFVFLFTKYTGGRESYVSTSPDGIHWSEDAKIAGFGGHYQASWKWKNKLGTAFNWHPPVGGLNARTNLYYMETRDFGKTWVNAAGKPLVTPLNAVQNDAMVHDYQKDGLLVYINDVNYDSQGRPVIFYNLGKGYESGPKFGPRTMMTARWTGKEWVFRKVGETDHNYDMGSLYIEDDGTWRIIAPSDPGPQPWSTGGDMVMWVSKDKGKSWEKTALTHGSAARASIPIRRDKRNHSYARKPVDAHPDFYAFWADGDAFKPSVSCLYFTSRDGDVTAMPYRISDK